MPPRRGIVRAPVLRAALLLLTAICLAFGAGAGLANSLERRPNVILVLTDDQGYGDLGLHGNDKIRTPNLDRFGREGTQLTRFYVCPVCAPTRASLMTGGDFYRTGVIHTSRGGAKMHGDEITLAELLVQAGYRTGIFGKWHLGDNYPMRPQDQGFQEVLVHKSGGLDQPPDQPNSYFNPILWHNGKRTSAQGYCTDVFFNAALRFIEENRKHPFFIYLPTNTPHTPLQVDPQYSDPYKAMGLNDTTAKVYGMVQNIDENFGRLIDCLERLGLRENTLVIFLTDNGPQQERYNAGMRRRKSWTYQGGIRVPCLVQWPARFKGPQQVDRIAAHIDWLPTLLEACAIPKPATLKIDGLSLVPLLTGQVAPAGWPDRKLFFQVHRGLEPKRYQNCAVVTQNYKLVGYPHTFNKDDLQTSHADPVLELYALAEDFGEQKDLAKDQPKIVAELRRAYDAWFDDMQRARQFEPGLIHLGSEVENPVHLCRYQDATYVGKEPRGWRVRVEHGGRYEVNMPRGTLNEPGRLAVLWKGREIRIPFQQGQARATVDLSAGEGTLDVWLELGDTQRKVISEDGTSGDVEVRWLK